MSEEKPVRIEGDPEGYDPVVNTSPVISCLMCALDGLRECENAPCLTENRPDNCEIYYVKKESAK